MPRARERAATPARDLADGAATALVRKLLLDGSIAKGGNMQPIQITYHGLEPSEALTELIHCRADQLARVSDRLHGVRVLVDAPHRHHRQGNHYHVRIELAVPGQEIVVGHDDDDASDEDAYQAVRRAFDAVRRRLTTAQARRRAVR